MDFGELLRVSALIVLVVIFFMVVGWSLFSFYQLLSEDVAAPRRSATSSSMTKSPGGPEKPIVEE